MPSAAGGGLKKKKEAIMVTMESLLDNKTQFPISNAGPESPGHSSQDGLTQATIRLPQDSHTYSHMPTTGPQRSNLTPENVAARSQQFPEPSHSDSSSDDSSSVSNLEVRSYVAM